MHRSKRPASIFIFDVAVIHTGSKREAAQCSDINTFVDMISQIVFHWFLMREARQHNAQTSALEGGNIGPPANKS